MATQKTKQKTESGKDVDHALLLLVRSLARAAARDFVNASKKDPSNE